LAGKTYQIPVKGTHAHSWVMAFPTELESFRAYAQSFPEACTLLVDTYDTLQSGLPNAITVGLELREKGYELAGIRLDSGDLAALSKAARARLDEAGLQKTKIVASNDLDEYKIAALKAQGARIDIWGVGTNLVTCKDEPALGGVYKLTASGPLGQDMQARIKVSSNPIKTTTPGAKQCYRFYTASQRMIADMLALSSEAKPRADQEYPCYATDDRSQCRTLKAPVVRPLLNLVYDGKRLGPSPTLEAIRANTIRSLESLPQGVKNLSNPDTYWVGLSQELSQLREELLKSGPE